MSAQGTTLRRGTVHVPMWPVAALIAAGAAIVLATASVNETDGATTFAPTLVERFANSGAIPAASVNETGATTNPCPEACQLVRRG